MSAEDFGGKHCSFPNSKRNRKEASLSPSEQEVILQTKKRISENVTMDLEQISNLLDTKLQPIKDSLDVLNDLVRKNAILEGRLEQQNKTIADMQTEIDFLRSMATSKNLIFKNITCDKETNLDNWVKNMCKDVLNVSETVEVDNAQFIGRMQKNILVEFRSRNVIRSVLANAKKLQGTGMRIEKDLPKTVRVKNNKLLAIRSKLKKINRNFIVYVRNGVMTFQNKKFVWENDGGLLIDNQDGVLYLKEMYNLDISDIVEKFKKENIVHHSQE